MGGGGPQPAPRAKEIGLTSPRAIEYGLSGMAGESRKGMRWPIYTALGVWCVVGSVAEAQVAVRSDEEALLRTRVMNYWEAEAQKEYVVAYQFLEPKVRATVPLPDFVRMKRYLTVKGFRVEGIEIRGDSASVRVAFQLEVEIPPPPPGMERVTTGPITKEGVTTERWILMDGTWFRRVEVGAGGVR